LTSILKHIDRLGESDASLPSSEQVWEQIKDICVKTLMSGVYQIEHVYKSAKPLDLEDSLCFQIFGVDIFLDAQARAWLLEVNHSPSFCTDSPLDYNIKKNVLRDTLHMLNLSQKRKSRYLNQQRNEKEKRLVEHQRQKREAAKDKQKEKEELKFKKLLQKDAFENNNMGDFQNLYPLPRGYSKAQDQLMDLYDHIYHKLCRQVYQESIPGSVNLRNKFKEE